MIMYHYAFDENNNIVSIDDINKETRDQHKYYCINCGSEMIAKLGEHNAHHFAHLSDAECKGGFESYIHELAKYLFYIRFYQSKQLLLRYEIKERCCCIDDCKIEVDKGKECFRIASKDLDVRKYYDQATLEKGFDKYRADVLLEDSTGKKKPLMVEIFVKHKCSEEKQHSGNPIFEIYVENEEDAWILYKADIVEGTTYNFNQNKFRSDKCLGIDLPMNTFVLYPDGKTWIRQKNRKCDEITKPLYRNSCLEIVYDRTSQYDTPSLLLKAKEIGFKIKDCRLCSYYKLPNGWSSMWVCCLYKRGQTPHHPDTQCAYGCSCYREMSSITKLDKDPYIVKSSQEAFNQIDFSSVYKVQMEQEKNERERLLKRQEEEKARDLKEQQDHLNAYLLRQFKWFLIHFEHETFKLECAKDDVPSVFISKNTEIFEDDLIHIDFKPRFNECKILPEKYVLDLYNKDDQSLEHLYIKVLFSNKLPQTIKKEDAMVIFVFIDEEERLLDFWNSTYVKFLDFSNCEIRNKKKIIDEIVSYNYK